MINSGTSLSRLDAAYNPDADYERFCQSVHARTGLDLDAYKRRQMERRIRSFAERAGARTLQDYWQILVHDSNALNTFLDQVTINVSEFFRNPEKFDELRHYVLPALMRENPSLYIWSAGCSYGAEAYSVRMILEQIAPGSKHRIWATDIDDRSLARARAGRYIADDIRHVPAYFKRTYFTQVGDEYQLSPAAQRDIEFARHDMLKQSFPRNLDLILCRNVVIYFTEETKQQLFQRFARALRPGGYLLVGNTERVANADSLGLSSPRPFLYYKHREVRE